MPDESGDPQAVSGPSSGNSGTMRGNRARTVAVLTGLGIAILLLIGGVTAAAQETTALTADRTVESDIVAPNETVNVTVTMDLGDGADDVSEDSKLAASEYFDTSFKQTEVGYGSVRYNDERIIPSTRFGDQDGVIVGLTPDRTPKGTFASGDELTVEYTVRVPDTASDGDTFGIDGTARLGDTETEISGTDTLTVGQSDGSDGSDTSSSPSPAEFLVTRPVADPLVATQSGDVEIEGVVRNEGGQSATKWVEIRLDNRTIQNTSVRLEQTERQRINATIDTADLNGTYTYTISTEDDTTRGTLDVTTGLTAFQLSNLTNVSTSAGDSVPVAVDVTNVGEESGRTDVAFRLETATGDILRNETRTAIELASGEVRSVAFENVSMADLDPGTYRYAVSVGDVTHSDSFTVETATNTSPGTDTKPGAANTSSPTATGDQSLEPGGLEPVTIVAMLVLLSALGTGGVLYRRRAE